MRRLARRGMLSGIALLGVALLVYLWHVAHGMTLSHPSLVSGWGLLLIMVLLTAYNLRKKLAFLPLAPSATWLQVHVYAGFLSILFYGLHTGFAAPDGLLESTLAVLYLVVVGSGVVGLYVSRRFPPLLTNRGEEVIFERIPGFYRRQRQAVETLVLDSARGGGSTAIPEFYERRLHAFFSGPRHFWHHLRESRRPLTLILTEMEDLERFVGADEKEVLVQVGDYVRAKDDLDYTYAHQAVLKYWLFLHLPLAYSLMILGVAHVILVHAFGGIR